MSVANILRSIAFLGQIFEDYPESNPRIETLAILPSIKNPRWIIPLKNKELIISSLALYQPSLLKAKLFKKMTVLTAKSGLSEVIAKDKIYLQKKDDFIRELFKKDNLHYAFFTGTEGCHRKVTVQVMDEDATILGYIKVSDNEDIERLLKNEAEILGDLSRLEIRNGLFPAVLYQGKIKDTNVLILNTLKSVNSKFTSRLSDPHISFLSELFRKTARSTKYKESGFAKGLRERIAKLETWRLRDCYEMASDFIEGKIGNIETPFGICHRDFTPWNTFFHNGQLYIFDWEYAEKDYPPLMDLFHFIIQDGILVRHLKPDGLLKRVIKHEKLLNKYSSLVGIKNDLLMPLLACYLLDISLLYIEREKGKVDNNTLKTLKTWSGMMEMILAHGSSLIAKEKGRKS